MNPIKSWFLKGWFLKAKPWGISQINNFKIQKIIANIKDKKDDCKYQDAKEGFAHGENNPVPVVNIDIKIENNNDIITTLCNGLTRTNLLLANNIKYLVFSISKKLLLDDADSYFFIKNDEI